MAGKRSPEQIVEFAGETYQGRNWAYCGSSDQFHHFVQWRYDAMLGSMGRSSYLKRHRVPRTQLVIAEKFPRTRDMEEWRRFTARSLTEALEGNLDVRSEGEDLPAAWALKPE